MHGMVPEMTNVINEAIAPHCARSESYPGYLEPKVGAEMFTFYLLRRSSADQSRPTNRAR